MGWHLTSYGYASDLLDRLKTVTPTGGGSTTIDYNDAGRTVSVTQAAGGLCSSSASIVTKTQFDGLGRAFLQGVKSGATWNITKSRLDGLGRVTGVWVPYLESSAPGGLSSTA